MTVSVVKTDGALGAEIRGVDLRKPVDDETFALVRNAFYQNEVAYFRGQELTDAQHIAFSRRFGPLRKLKFNKLYSQVTTLEPEIFVVSNIVENGAHIGSYDAGLFWHTDGAFHEKPHAISMLRALEVPEADGRTLGDTEFASMTEAYDALPESMKNRLRGLHAVQSILRRYEKTVQSGGKKEEYSAEIKKQPEATHPVVRIHPVTGRKCLYVSEGYTVRIVGLPDDESRDLLAELVAHCTKPQFRYRHNWRNFDLVLWDDCSTQHKATFDYKLPQRRLMHRTTVISAPED